jgi:choice-of-anchor C domain-containing protein
MKANKSLVVWASVVAMSGFGALSYTSAAASPATPPTSGKNLIVNGSFSVPVVMSKVWTDFAAGSAAIKGWTVGGNSADVVGSSYWQEPPGYTQAIDLSGYASGSLTQTVPTQAGSKYLLGWWMAGNASSSLTKVMHVVWDGKLVDSTTFSETGHSTTSMGWAHETLLVTATSSSSTLTFADDTPNNGGAGAALGGVTLYLSNTTEAVNGFQVQNNGEPVALSGSYGSAELQMLAKLPATATVTAGGTAVAALTASSASQSPGGTGLTITWTEAPVASFLKASSTQQTAGAEAVEQYLSMLLTKSYSAYQAGLAAERIPPGATTPLSQSWTVRIAGVSTAGSLMIFGITQASPPTGTKTFSAISVPTVSAPLTSATAPAAVRDMLYYTKNVASSTGA